MLLDYLDVVVHVQHSEERTYYSLERIWKDCPQIPLPELVANPGSDQLNDRMRLVLWRHGQTAWNAERRFQGQSDIPLDEAGQAQAERAARLLAGLRPDLIVSSDLIRATGTAAPLARLTGLDVILDKDLRERHGGGWEGLTDAEIRARYPAEHAALDPPRRRADPSGRRPGRRRAARAPPTALATPASPWWSATAPRSGSACPGCSACRRRCSARSARCPTAHGRSSAGAATAGGCSSTTRAPCPSPF